MESLLEGKHLLKFWLSCSLQTVLCGEKLCTAGKLGDVCQSKFPSPTPFCRFHSCSGRLCSVLLTSFPAPQTPGSQPCSLVGDQLAQAMSGGISKAPGHRRGGWEQLGAPWKGVAETCLVINPPANGGLTATRAFKETQGSPLAPSEPPPRSLAGSLAALHLAISSPSSD